MTFFITLSQMKTIFLVQGNKYEWYNDFFYADDEKRVNNSENWIRLENLTRKTIEI